MVFIFSFYRNYIFQRVPFTNLVMLVTYSGCSCATRSVSLEPVEVIYDEDVRCDRMRNGTFRKLPEPCVHHHPEVSRNSNQYFYVTIFLERVFWINQFQPTKSNNSLQLPCCFSLLELDDDTQRAYSPTSALFQTEKTYFTPKILCN